MQLRPYQIDALNAASASFNQKKRHLIVLPTGSGKTFIFCEIAKHLNLKTLVVAHTKEIISQTKIAAKESKANIVSKSIQSASRSLDAIANEGYELLIIDECHRSHAKSYKILIDVFNNKHILGVTATPFRYDKQRLDEIFGKAIFSLPLIQMIEDGFLCDFEGYRVRTSISLSGIRKQRGDFQEGALSSVVNVANRNELIVNEYVKIAGGEKSLCFCADVKHALELKNAFQASGVSAEAIYGDLPDGRRKQILADFNQGKIQVLTNCQVLTEGFNEPSISCLIMARPTCSKVLYMQMIGRGSRTFPGKEVCKVIEFTDNDFDVCFLEDIIDKKIPNFRIKPGERLSSGFSRNKKELEQIGEATVVEKTIIIPKTIYERSATEWQLDELKKRNIPFKMPISEFLANKLLFTR